MISPYVISTFIVCFLGISCVVSCPRGCTCSRSNIDCHDLNFFPDLNGVRAQTLVFEDCTIPNIPKDAFTATGLISIVIKHSTIGSIDTGSFRNLESLQHLLIIGPNHEKNNSTAEWTVINEIQPRAFENLSNIKKLYLSFVKIGRIRTNAFSDVSNLNEFIMVNSEIIFAETKAFVGLSTNTLNLTSVDIKDRESSGFDYIRDVTRYIMEDVSLTVLSSNMFFSSVSRLQVSSSHFETMDCNVFSENGPTVVDWWNNSIACDCRLEWLLNAEEAQFPEEYLNEFICNGPEFVGGKRLSGVVRQEYLPCPSPLEPRASCSVPLYTPEEEPDKEPEKDSGTRPGRVVMIVLLPIFFVIIIIMALYIWYRKYNHLPLNVDKLFSRKQTRSIKSQKRLSSTGGGLANQHSIRNNLVRSQRSFIYVTDEDEERRQAHTRLYQPRSMNQHIPYSDDSAYGEERDSHYEELPDEDIPAPESTPVSNKRSHYDIPQSSFRSNDTRYGPEPRGRPPLPSESSDPRNSGRVTDDDDYLLPVERRSHEVQRPLN